MFLSLPPSLKSKIYAQQSGIKGRISICIKAFTWQTTLWSKSNSKAGASICNFIPVQVLTALTYKTKKTNNGASKMKKTKNYHQLLQEKTPTSVTVRKPRMRIALRVLPAGSTEFNKTSGLGNFRRWHPLAHCWWESGAKCCTFCEGQSGRITCVILTWENSLLIPQYWKHPLCPWTWATTLQPYSTRGPWETPAVRGGSPGLSGKMSFLVLSHEKGL